jgi:hypothetical protein
MSLNHNIVFLAAVTGLAGCASPDVVQTRQINDDDLSCSQLVTATKEAQKFEADAREGRTVTGTNVAAALFWWPGLVATYVNTDDAIDAAVDRQTHLAQIYKDKGCSGGSSTTNSSNSVSGDLEKLKKMHADGLISDDEYAAARKKALGIQ